MKSIPRNPSRLLSAAAAFAVCTAALHAGTVSTTFSFQKEDVRKDGNIYVNGPFDGAAYAGVVDGRIADNATTSARTTTATARIGNGFQSGAPNGRQDVGLFSYDLTELQNFITANTGTYSSVTIQSVSFKLISAGGNAGGAMNLNLYGTDPFTSSCTWSTYDGTNVWTVPYQNIGSTAAYGYTGGGSALTAQLGGGTLPNTSVTSGNTLTWNSSANFITALTDALARTDKTLYLTVRGSFFNTGDNRLNVYFSPDTSNVDNRPELVVTLDVTTTAAPAAWTGGGGNNLWTTAGNWSPSGVPATDAPINFNSSSTANLNTVLNQDFTVTSVTVTDPTGAVSIGGANSLNLGAGGFDLSAATQNLTVTTPIVTGAAQSWSVASGRILSVSGAVTGSSDITIAGAGKVSLGASGILPNGASAGNVIVNGTLGLNGTTQSVNALTGTGTVDNTNAAAATLTIGNNNAGGTFSGTIQNTGGALALVKTGSGTLTLGNANTFSGGLTLNGGTVNSTGAAGANTCFGTGTVVANSGTIYMAAGSWAFANALTLNGGTLRQGGGNNRLLTWNGDINVTSSSAIQSDGSTAGITIGGNITLGSGTILTSTAGGSAHTINGTIGGTGGLISNSGTLVLNAASSYTGSTQINAGTLLLGAGGTIPATSNLTINGTGNFAVRNTGGWTYNGTITGEGTGSINLNTATNAILAGDISGVATINANSNTTDVTISGAISGPANLTVQNTGSPILRLGGANSYTGTTTIQAGTLVLASNNVLPDATAVTIIAGTLDAGTHTDTAGTLAVTGAATINLGTGAALAFADSSAITWTGASLTLTGTFVSGSSLRFGTDANGLTPTQLGLISATGFSGFALNSSGYLTATAAGGYSTWAATNGTAQTIDLDHDNDGVSNGVEYFLGGNSNTTGFTALPGVTNTAGTLSVTWTKAGDYTGTYGTDFVVETSDTLVGAWATAAQGAGAGQVEITGNDVKFTFPAGTKKFARLKVTGP